MSGAIKRVDLANKEYGTVTGFFKTFKIAYQAIRYAGLLAILVILASHEAANPKLGTTTFEFYSTDFREGISALIANQDINSGPGISSDQLVEDFFEQRNYLPAWTVNFNVNENFRELMGILYSAHNFGLFPHQYKAYELSALETKLSSSLSDVEKIEIRALLEKQATLSSLEIMRHLAGGVRVNDTSKAYGVFVKSLPTYLNKSISEKMLQASFQAMQPKSREYVKLQSALSRYWAKAGSDTISYLEGQLVNDTSLIIDRLVSQGFLNAAIPFGSSMFENAIIAFQKANTIQQTGILDSKTIKALSLSSSDRFIKIALNLDRLRKDALSSQNCILVNIPEFKLHYYNQKGDYTAFNVVVGKTYSRTPLLSSSITRIVANPYWTVPKSITHNEIIPKLKKDSLYLKKHGFKVIDNYENDVDASLINWDEVTPDDFNYWIRQNNSSSNALGVVKFLFPNKYSVYLHDTQSKRLFKKNVRAYSHGCVRVENPQELAQIIANDYITSKKKKIDFAGIVKNKERKELYLTDSLPIHIRYYTCTADSEGTIYFHPDIYKYDDNSIAELFSNMAKI